MWSKTKTGDKMLKKDVNMLEGSIFKGIVSFTIPIILSNILQVMFNAADLIVVGRFCGSNSVAAVGATTSLTHLFINLFIGISVGCGITVAQALGANDREMAHKTVHTAIPLAIIIGLFLTVVGITFSESLLRLMETPESFFGLSSTYMKIYFAGIIGSMLYNFSAAILRAAGDTRSPLLFLSIAGVINVVLNVIFVTVFDLNVAGVALATTISQFVSAGMTIFALRHRTGPCHFSFKQMKIYKEPILKILKIGVPSGIQSSMFSFSSVLIQSSINSLGAVTVAGSSAASNIEGFVYVIMNAFYQTTLNFTGQNIGNKNFKRVKRIAFECFLSVSVVGLLCGIVTRIFAKNLLSIYITDSSSAIAEGIVRLTFICMPYFLCGIMEVLTGGIRGMGVSLPPMIISIIGVCVFRVVWVYTVFAHFRTGASLYISYPISWLLVIFAELVVFKIVLNKKIQNK